MTNWRTSCKYEISLSLGVVWKAKNRFKRLKKGTNSGVNVCFQLLRATVLENMPRNLTQNIQTRKLQRTNFNLLLILYAKIKKKN